MDPEGSLSRRALLALALWAGYYLLAVGLAAGLFVFAFGLFAKAGTVPPSVAFSLGGLAAVAGALILWAAFPRWERFRPPGPRLDPKRQAALVGEVRAVAERTGQRPPSDCYVELSANAWVGNRGGFLGLFTRRVLTVGLPLLNVLTRPQLRAVLAHEFGHYVAGDTRLGPWVHKTQAAIHRTLAALEDGDSIWIHAFAAYGRLFSRVSLAVSQRQELAADALAARVAGSRAMAEALRRTEEAAAAFPSFARDELQVLLNLGYRAPICEGFDRFLAAREVSRAVRLRVGRVLSGPRLDPMQTHPPLPQRLEAIAGLPEEGEPLDEGPALWLVAELDALEAEMLVAITGDPKVATLPLIGWEEAAEKAYLPGWRKEADRARPHLKGITPESFPDLGLTELGRLLAKEAQGADARQAATAALGSALIVALHVRGWKLRAMPGERPAALLGDVCVEPFHVHIDLAEGSLTRDAWRALCAKAQIEGADLGAGSLAE
jgi:Zn-dependent protease with chaperone function